MSQRWVIASSNHHKVKEFQQILEPLGVRLVTPSELDLALDVEETGDTFAANAELKARAWAAATGLPAVADDSGLEIDALDGAPGVYSARFAGVGAGDAANNARMVRELQALGLARSTARYRCAIVLFEPAGSPDLVVVDGTLEGHVVTSAAGEGGFGYDPYFVMPDGRHLAQWTSAEKNAVSHRGQALRALLAALA
jgi:XTP/dITP diphosphohydrolase